MNIINITNGVSLCYIPSDKFKTNLISINLQYPLKKEIASANALLSMVLRRGTENFTSLTDINKELEDMYGASLIIDVKKKGDIQVVKYAIEFLRDSALKNTEDLSERAINLLSQILFRPLLKDGKFDREFVESEKKNLIDLINSRINDKRSYAVFRCFEEMCKDEAFGIFEYGDIETVSQITPETLYDAYVEIIKTSVITIFCIGKFDETSFTDKLKSLFTMERKPVALTNEVVTTVDDVKFINEKIDVEQAKLSLGFRTGISSKNENTPALSLFSTIYGGSPHSKLFENVREKLSLCYYCASRLEKHKGLMIVYSGIEEKNKEKAENEILNQLEIIKKGDVTDLEFDSAKKALINAYKSASDSMASMEDWYLSQLMAQKSSSLEEESEKIMAVKKDDVIEVSKNIVLDTVYLLSSKTPKEEIR